MHHGSFIESKKRKLQSDNERRERSQKRARKELVREILEDSAKIARTRDAEVQVDDVKSKFIPIKNQISKLEKLIFK